MQRKEALSFRLARHRVAEKLELIHHKAVIIPIFLPPTSTWLKEREESNEESDAGGEKEEDESVKPEVPACTELTDILNKLVNPETNDLADDIDEDELEGVHISDDNDNDKDKYEDKDKDKDKDKYKMNKRPTLPPLFLLTYCPIFVLSLTFQRHCQSICWFNKGTSPFPLLFISLS